MECPYCKKEMQQGNIYAANQLAWCRESDEPDLAQDTVELAGLSLFGKYIRSFYCPDCRRVIIPVPTKEEQEGPLTKLEKKWDAWHERRSQELEQRQAEKDAEKKQQKREKSRKKDPWEV